MNLSFEWVTDVTQAQPITLWFFLFAVTGFTVVFFSIFFTQRWKKSTKKQQAKEQGVLPAGMARELSCVERGFKYITDISVGLIGCCFVIKSDKELGQEFFHFLTRSIWNYAPLLRMNIVDLDKESKSTKKRFFFKEIDGDEPPFDGIIKWRTLDQNSTLLNEVEREICIPFNSETEPLWRLIVYDMKDHNNNSDCENNTNNLKCLKGVVIVVNHTVCDGVGMGVLYKKVPQVLYEYVENNSCKVSEVNKEIPIPVDDLVPKISFQFWFEMVASLASKILSLIKVVPPFQHEFLDKFKPPIALDKNVVPAPKILTFKMNAELTSNLIKATKANKCTFTGTLAAAMGIASVKFMQDGVIKKRSTFRIAIPVDLRKYFVDKRYDDQIANYISISPLAIKCTIRPCKDWESEYDYFWSVARKVTSEIGKLVYNLETIKAIPVVAPFMDHPSFVSDVLKKALRAKNLGRIALYSISNMGIVNGPAEAVSPKYQIDQVSFGANEVMGGSIFTNNIATYDGCLMWNFCYAVHCVSNENAAAIFYKVKQTLNSVNYLPNK